MSDETYILSAVDIMSMSGEMKTHFLNKDARRMQKSLGKATGLTEIDFSIVEVAPGDESTEHHLHYHEEECWYVLEGEATARDWRGKPQGEGRGFRGLPQRAGWPIRSRTPARGRFAASRSASAPAMTSRITQGVANDCFATRI